MNFSFLNNLPGELATFIMAMLPIAEVRVSIPMGLFVYGLPISSALFWSLLGNLSIGFLIIVLINPLASYLFSKSEFFRKFFNWIFLRTRNKFYDKYQRFGDLALVLFIAIPLPTTGIWTGSIAAWLFGIEKKKSFILVSIGAIIAAAIVSFASLGIYIFAF